MVEIVARGAGIANADSMIPRVPETTRLASQLSQAFRGAAMRTLMCGNRLYAMRYHEMRVCRPCRVPRHGPGIIVCNHISGLDPLLIQAACPRPIAWMMAAEYHTPLLGWAFSVSGIIQVERSGRDLSATRSALRALREGRLVGIFPEGRLSRTGQVLPFQSGVAVLATRSGAPVYPAYIEGSQRGQSMSGAFTGPHTSQLVFGEPLRFGSEGAVAGGIDGVIQRIECAVRELAGKIEGYR